MKTLNVNYFFKVSSENRVDFVETINKLLILENLLKIGKLRERELTSAEDDLHFLYSLNNLKLPKIKYFETEVCLENQSSYADFKSKLVQEKETASDTLDEEIFSIFKRNMGSHFFYFNENKFVSTLAKWIKNGKNNGKSYCPFNSIINAEDELAVDYVDAPFFGTYKEYVTKTLIHMLKGNVNKINNYFISFEDQLTNSAKIRKVEQYDFGFSCLPMGVRLENRKQNLEDIYIEDMLDSIQGRFSVIAPQRISFANNAQTHDLRKKIVSSKRLKAIIRLPSGFLVGTSISPIALVFESQDVSSEIVSFLDLNSKEYIENGKSGRKFAQLNQKAQDEIENALNDKADSLSLKVALSEINTDNDFNLDIGRYQATIEEEASLEGIDTVTLEEIAEIYRAQASRSEENGDKYYEISALDIDPLGNINIPKKEICVNKGSRTLKNLVHKGDIVLAIKGSTGKVGLVEAEHDNWLAGQSFVILRLKDKAWTPEFLFWQLNSKRIKNQLGLLSTGGFIQLLKISDVKGLKLIPPTAEILQKVHDANIRKVEIVRKIKELQSELASLDEII